MYDTPPVCQNTIAGLIVTVQLECTLCMSYSIGVGDVVVPIVGSLHCL